MSGSEESYEEKSLGGNELEREVCGEEALSTARLHGEAQHTGHASARPTPRPPPTFTTGIWGGSVPASGSYRGREAGNQENLIPNSQEA